MISSIAGKAIVSSGVVMRLKALAAILLCVALVSPIPLTSAVAGYSQDQACLIAGQQIPNDDRATALATLKKFLGYAKNYNVKKLKNLMLEPAYAELLCDKSDGFLYTLCKKQNKKLSFSRYDVGGFVKASDSGWVPVKYDEKTIWAGARVKYRDYSKAFKKALKEYLKWYTKKSKSGRVKVSDKKSVKYLKAAVKRNVKRYGYKTKVHDFSVTLVKANGKWKVDFSEGSENLDEEYFQSEIDALQMGWYRAYNSFLKTESN